MRTALLSPSLLVLAIFVVSLLDLTAGSANAYLDPGTGSQALQIGVAGLLGAAFTLRGFFARLFRTLRRKR